MAIAVKVQFGDEIRRLRASPEESFASLEQRISNLFSIPPKSDVVMKFMDRAGEHVAFPQQEKMSFALANSASPDLLRVVLFQPSTHSSSTPKRPSIPVQSQLHEREFGLVSSPIRPTYPIDPAAKSSNPESGLPSLNYHHPPAPYFSSSSHQRWEGKEEPWKLKGRGRPQPSDSIQPSDLPPGLSRRLGSDRSENSSDPSASHPYGHPTRGGRRGGRGRDSGVGGEGGRRGGSKAHSAHPSTGKGKGGGGGGGLGGNKKLAKFVEHVTYPDDSVVQPGQPFLKTWRFRNEMPLANEKGTLTPSSSSSSSSSASPLSDSEWPVNSRLVFVGKHSDQMGGPDFVEVREEARPFPSEEVDLSVQLIAPKEPGEYVGYWRLSSEDGRRFGQRVRVKIRVP